jgi:threonine dehydrogenase-like Zn-dependent dehydrogenase
MGHEAYGEIVEIGSKIEGYEVGDKIVWWCTMGAFADYVKINPKNVAIVKFDKIENENELPIFELLIATYRAVEAVNVIGKNILIIGMGPSGLIMTQLCLALGAKSVTGWDLNKKRLELAKEFGAIERENNFDIVIDAYGNDLTKENNTINLAVSKLKVSGELILYGHPINGRNINSHLIQSRSINIKTPINSIEEIRKLANKALVLYKEGKINIGRLVTRVIKFEEIKNYIENTDNDIKIIIEVNK